MPGTLCDQMLEAHRVPTRTRSGRGSATSRLAVRADHVVVDGEAAALVLRMFEALGGPRTGADLLLVGAGEPRFAEDGALRAAAIRDDAVFSRAGNGPIHRVHAARFAAPGRMVVGADERVLMSGAYGMLALVANPVEIAAALAGEALEVVRPETVSVRLFGRAPSWVGGDDVALELGRRLGAERVMGRHVEFQVLEPDGLSFAARESIASQAASWGARSALFASDEATRRYLLRQQREVDWKPQALDLDPGRSVLDLDFSDLEPLVRGGDGESIVALRECAGQAVDVVWMGPELPLDELARLVGRLEGRRIHERVRLLVSLGDRQARASAARAGWIDALRRAGARVVTEELPRHPDVPAGPGLCLACGAPSHTRPSGRWRATGADACVAAALGGALSDPRSLPAVSAGEPVRLVIDDRLLDRPTTEARAAVPAAAPVNGMPIAPPISGALRGTVLLKLGDHVGVNRILPWGARMRPLALQVDTLKGFAFAGVDRGFATRAAAHSGGWVVAGRSLGAGPRREQIGMVAVRLGVRAILALGFDPSFRSMLLQHGVLALRFVTAGDYQDVRAGDELEIPDLPEVLETGKPLVVRNLTRGAQYALLHDLDADEIAEVRAGGRLAATRRGAPGGGA